MGVLCIFGEREELMPAYVAWLAEKSGCVVVWLCESELGAQWSFALQEGKPDARCVEGYIETTTMRYPLASLNGAYVHLCPKPAVPYGLELSPAELQVLLTARRQSIRYLIEALPCPVGNRLRAGRSNNSKPYQMALLAQMGFAVPRWIVSNEEAAVATFCDEMAGKVIAKSCSGLRSQVSMVGQPLLAQVSAGTTPVIAQEFIAGVDVRVHTVMGKAFPTEIVAAGVDYRFDEGVKEYREATMPAHWEALCHRFAQAEELLIAGFDFKVTPQGEWYCLEVNPVPTFLPYEMATGQPIGAALVEALGGEGFA